MKSHIGLAIWKKAIQFVTIIYKITKNVPIEKMYTLSNQMRRAVISIPSNIAKHPSSHLKRTIH